MSAEIVRVSERSVKLCCNKKGCPTVTDIGEGKVEITDDYGNKIVVKKEEALLLSDGVKTLNGEKLLLG
jgi:hypothetical protein